MYRSRQFLTTVFLTLFILNPLWADDVEIFFDTVDKTTRPNLLFVLDGSGSMLAYDCLIPTLRTTFSRCRDGSLNGETTRLKRMVDALTEVFITAKDVNIGLMRFSHSYNGGRIIYPITNIDDPLCNNTSCQEDSVFTARVSSREDDLYEDNTGSVINWDTVTPLNLYDGDLPARVSALRFTNLRIPQGATVTDARIIFQSASDSMTNADLGFRIEDTHDSIPFEQGMNKITNRQWSPDTVLWSAVEPWTVDNTYNSPDLSNFVNRVVNKADWCGGNAVSFSIQGSGDRLASTYEHGDHRVAALRVQYRIDNIPDTGGCMLAPPETGLIQSSTSDVTERLTGGKGKQKKDQGKITATGSQLVNPDFMSAFSFTGLNIPQGAQIKSAKLVLSTTDSFGTQVSNVSLENNANPFGFSYSAYDLSNRQKTSAIQWTNAASGVSDLTTENISDQLSAQIQTIVSRFNWSPGNRINLFLQHVSGNTRTFQSYETNSSKAARLEIEYYGNINDTTDDNGTAADVRTALINELAEFKASGGTPTVGALLEARRYFAGAPVNYGKTRGWDQTDRSIRYSRVSHDGSYTGGDPHIPAGCSFDPNSQYCAGERIDEDPVYISPIEHECQANHIILLTDGDPNDTGRVAKTAAQTLINGTCAYTNAAEEGLCGAEVASFMTGNPNDTNKGDADDPHDLHPGLPGRQNVKVHTIGFNLDHPWLNEVASAGDGDYYTADSAAELIEAISKITTEVTQADTTFVAPGATVDQFSRLSHREDIYVSLFKPNKRAGWKGNLKKYLIKGLPPTIFDANDVPAVDIADGVFKAGAQSYWSATPDGNNSLLGGAASLLDPYDRNLVSYFNGNNTELFTTTNKITADNTLITQQLFNADSDAELTQMIDWLYGFDVLNEDDDITTDLRRHMGDPLHSQPQLITYGGTQEDPDSMVVFGTNDGFLHGINTRDGSEEFAFMPETLFTNLKKLYDNDPIASSDDRVYGMDGDLTVWINEEDNNGIVDANDTVYLYAGMRRGGRDYWVLDLSDRTNPKFKAQIAGGQGDFIELGETWSKPIIARIKIGATIRPVLIFAGGYDNSQDDKDTRLEDTVGRAVYIVDAENPTDILWSGSGHPQAASYTNTKYFDKMRYSIPSDVLVVNDGSDKLASQIYVGDMGGQVWRFDVNNGADEGSDLVAGGVIADLADNDQPTTNRRFYFPPDLSLAIIDGEQTLNIGIGSGYEAHPLNTTIKDNFHLIRYPFAASGNYGMTDPWTAADVYRPITIHDLYDATDNTIEEGTDDEIANAREALANSQGWFIEMPRSGEKILGASTTLNNIIRFVSYEPAHGNGNGCLPDVGVSYYWSLNILDGTASGQNTSDSNSSETTASQPRREIKVPTPGRAPPVKVIFTKSEDSNGKITVTPTDVSGINVLGEGETTSKVERVYWSEYPD